MLPSNTAWATMPLLLSCTWSHTKKKKTKFLVGKNNQKKCMMYLYRISNTHTHEQPNTSLQNPYSTKCFKKSGVLIVTTWQMMIKAMPLKSLGHFSADCETCYIYITTGLPFRPSFFNGLPSDLLIRMYQCTRTPQVHSVPLYMYKTCIGEIRKDWMDSKTC